MDKMMQKISAYPNGTLLRISWDSGKTAIEGIIDTIYETDNGAEDDEDQYQEFYACAVLVKRIIRNRSSTPPGSEYVNRSLNTKSALED